MNSNINIFKPLVSIIIPVYNGSNFLKTAIESALEQSYSNLEVIVVNDGSNDFGETEKIALSFGTKIKYYFKENGGVSTALNLGIKKMQGDYFSWLSHDDLYSTEKIQKQIDFLSHQENKEIIIYSDFIEFSENTNKLNLSKVGYLSNKSFLLQLTTKSTIHGCSLLIPRSVFEKVGLFNENLKYTQDYDMWFRIAQKFRFLYIEEPLVISRIHSSQGSNIFKSKSKIEEDSLISGFILKLNYSDFNIKTKDDILNNYLSLYNIMMLRGLIKARKSVLYMIYKEIEKFNLFNRSLIKIKILFMQTPFYYLGLRINRILTKIIFFIEHKAKAILFTLKIKLNFNRFFKQDRKIIFTNIYRKNKWGSNESASGVGSELNQTQELIKGINKVLLDFKIKSILDIPCGDFNWMKKVDLNSINYLGADIVPELIEKNSISYSIPGKIEFKVLDIVSDNLPKVDLIIVRDCLVHLSNAEILTALKNLKNSGSKYILTTTFPEHSPNFDIATGDWRPLNLFIEPFFFSNPLIVINENCTEDNGSFRDKSMGLWEIN